MPFSFADQIDREYARTRQEPDEASELRLSIIERLDARHADIVADLDLLGDAEFHPLPGVRTQYAEYVAEEQALWSALEIVRNLEGVPAWRR